MVGVMHESFPKKYTTEGGIEMRKPYFTTELGRLYNGDTCEVMRELVANGDKVSKIITSPPYNTDMNDAANYSGKKRYDVHVDTLTNEDYIAWTVEMFNLYDQLLNENGCILYNMSYGAQNTELMSLTIAEIIKKTDFTLADMLVWKKDSAIPNNVSSNKLTRIVEYVYVFCRRSEFNTFKTNKKVLYKNDSGQTIYDNVFNYFTAKNNDYCNELNKATFSVQFVNNLLDRYVLADDVVLDNFNGTGTTGYACEQRNRKWIGIELSEAQCKHTEKRCGRVQQSFLD